MPKELKMKVKIVHVPWFDNTRLHRPGAIVEIADESLFSAVCMEKIDPAPILNRPAPAAVAAAAPVPASKPVPQRKPARKPAPKTAPKPAPKPAAKRDPNTGQFLVRPSSGDGAGEEMPSATPVAVPASESPPAVSGAAASLKVTPAGAMQAEVTPAGEKPAGETLAGATPEPATPVADTPAADTPAPDTAAGDATIGRSEGGQDVGTS